MAPQLETFIYRLLIKACCYMHEEISIYSSLPKCHPAQVYMDSWDENSNIQVFPQVNVITKTFLRNLWVPHLLHMYISYVRSTKLFSRNSQRLAISEKNRSVKKRLYLHKHYCYCFDFSLFIMVLRLMSPHCSRTLARVAQLTGCLPFPSSHLDRICRFMTAAPAPRY